MVRLRAAMIVAVGAIVLWPPSAAAQDCTPNKTVAIQLTRSRPASGGVEIAPGCWMPQVRGAQKAAAALCAHGVEHMHDFAFTLENSCNVDVHLELTVDRGWVKLRRSANGQPTESECGTGKPRTLFADYLAPAVSQTFTCANRSHWKWWPFKWTRRGSYALKATAVRAPGGEPVEFPVPVDYDPEIVIEDNGKTGFHFRVVLWSVLLGWAGWRVYRRWVRAR